jgi:hypothetical protein
VPDSSRPADTSPAALEAQFAVYRAMSPAQKAARVTELTQSACLFALAGLRERHPGANERELFLRLAVLRLGEELVHRVYGWRASDGA